MNLTIRIWCLTLLLFLVSVAFSQQGSQIAEIEIRGLANVNRDQIIAVMRTKVGQPYIQAQLDQDKKAIDDLGFFQAVDVRAQEVDAQAWKVVVQVTEYAKIKEIRIVGNSVIATEDIMKTLETAPAFPVAPGNIYNFKSARPCADAIEKLYADKGFFCRVSEFGPMEESPETVNVVLLELTVNQVLVQGIKRTKRSVIDRLIRTEPGKPFNTDVARQDYRRLFESQWFEDIKIVDRPVEGDGSKIDLIFDLKETQTGSLNFGVQVDPRSKIAGLVRYGDSNFRGSGQSLQANVVQGSSGGTSIDVDWSNPLYDDKGSTISASVYSRVLFRFANDQFGGGGGGSTSPTEDRFYERRTGAALALGKRYKETPNEIIFGSFGLRFENIRTSEIDTKLTEGFIQQDGDVATFSASITRDRRDVSIDASKGDWMRLTLEPGYSNITKVGGDISNSAVLGESGFFRSNIEFRKYWTDQPERDRTKLDDPRRVIAIRARAGTISGQVPFFEQFFVGGSDSLRGYNEDRFWGRHYAALTLEYRQPIQKSFNAVIFIDYGSAWGGYDTVGEFTQSNRPDFKVGYGAGFSFRTPLGPIRLDFGFDEKGKSRTHFLIGTSF